MSTDLVWFVTGCSTGIGRVIVETVLEAGHRAVATARNPTALADLSGRFGSRVLTLKLDVNEGSDIKSAVNAAMVRFGQIDVLINNAGYGLEGAIEETPIAQAKQQFDTNFFGLMAVTQAVLPTMRTQGSGYIVNVASVAGLRGFGGLGIYCASKFAVVGFTEALAQEVKPFGIRASVIELGPYRTDWAGRSLVRTPMAEAIVQGYEHTPTPYEALNANIRKVLDTNNGKQPGDPKQIAHVLMQAAVHASPPMHMLFGDEGIGTWQAELKKLADPAYFATFPHGKTDL
jgi:NAD(P)-dependent dehydrogenase (short-subunit alcohol dehydrogenase family)